MGSQSLVDVIQECLKLLNEYNLLCGKVRQLSTQKDKKYYVTCHKAYNCYERCYKLIFTHIFTMDEFKLLQNDNSNCVKANVSSLISVYNQLRRLLLTDTQIEKIKFEYYNYNIVTNYMNKLVANSWITMSFINNILNQRDKLTLIIEVDDHIEDPGRREIIPCRNYVRLPASLIQEADTVRQLQCKMQESLHVFPSETILFRERNTFDYIILITTDEENKQEEKINVHKMLILFERITKNLLPKPTTGLFPNVFISIIDFKKWDVNLNKNMNQNPLKKLNNFNSLPHTSQSSPNLLSQSNNDLIVGIHNQSNSCYVNSIVQSLLGTTELIDLLLKMGSSNVLFHPSRGNMIYTNFIKLIRHMVDSSNKTKAPVSIEQFKLVCGNKCSQFKGNEQEDCAEFCQFMIDSLNDELKTTVNSISVPTSKAISPADKNWLQFKSQNSSIITQLFVGQLSSILHCQNCGTSSTTFQTFSMLSLPIPRVASCNVMECLRQFFRPHDLGPTNQWNCIRCRRPTPSTQQLVLSKKPKIMIIQLKRFDNYLNKNNCFVQYPIILDQQYAAIQNLPKNESKYKLYAVVCHKGSINNGHYTTYVNKGAEKGWYYFDDTTYRPVRTPTEFISPEAYLLFYRLIQD